MSSAYTLIILVLSPLALCELPGNNSAMKCGDCAKENTKLCQIEKETGFSCFKGDRYGKRSPKKYIPERAPMTYDTDVCIPPGVTMDRDAEICCAWSPKTGCQLVLHMEHRGEFCSTCRLEDPKYEGLKICPCKTVSRSRSGQLNSGDLKLVIRMVVYTYVLGHIYSAVY